MNSPLPSALSGLSVMQRGWLSSNNVLLHGHGEGAVLIDSSHVLHASQTVALVRQALAGEPLQALVNTHLHSDHCGGNAAVQRAFGASVRIPPGEWDQAQRWHEPALSWHLTGQRCERFQPDDRIWPGQILAVGHRRWRVLAAPGHDPDSIMLFDEREGVLISADALWENGFGVVFPELDGDSGFAEVQQVLDLIESLQVHCVIPGHGAPFSDVQAALGRARSRLESWRADPHRHAVHAAKVLVKYHMMEERQQPWDACLSWFCGVPLCHSLGQRLGYREHSLQALGSTVLRQLVASGALRLQEGIVMDV